MGSDNDIAQVREGSMEVKPCKATNARGEPCSSPRVEGTEYCFWHNPDLSKERDAARKRGGLNRRQVKAAKPVGPVQAQTPEDLLILLEQALTDCLALENSISRAKAVGYLAGVILKVQEAQKAGGLEAQPQGMEKVIHERSSHGVPVSDIPIVRGALSDERASTG